jgi:hypothetical protein
MAACNEALLFRIVVDLRILRNLIATCHVLEA